MRYVLDLGELHAEVTRKAIKHVHLSVLPPAGKVRVAAPQSAAGHDSPVCDLETGLDSITAAQATSARAGDPP